MRMEARTLSGFGDRAGEEERRRLASSPPRLLASSRVGTPYFLCTSPLSHAGYRPERRLPNSQLAGSFVEHRLQIPADARQRRRIDPKSGIKKKKKKKKEAKENDRDEKNVRRLWDQAGCRHH